MDVCFSSDTFRSEGIIHHTTKHDDYLLFSEKMRKLLDIKLEPVVWESKVLSSLNEILSALTLFLLPSTSLLPFLDEFEKRRSTESDSACSTSPFARRNASLISSFSTVI